jgi:hypothetical protein
MMASESGSEEAWRYLRRKAGCGENKIFSAANGYHRRSISEIEMAAYFSWPRSVMAKIWHGNQRNGGGVMAKICSGGNGAMAAISAAKIA